MTAGDGEPEPVRGVSVQEMRVGMVLTEDVRTAAGLLLVAAGQEVSVGLLEKIGNFHTTTGLQEPLWVRIPETWTRQPHGRRPAGHLNPGAAPPERRSAGRHPFLPLVEFSPREEQAQAPAPGGPTAAATVPRGSPRARRTAGVRCRGEPTGPAGRRRPPARSMIATSASASPAKKAFMGTVGQP